MITRIEAFRYRCFDRLDINVGTFHVLAGANGSGKSTLLDIPVLLGDILKRGLTAAFLEDPSPVGGSPRAQTLRELVHHYRGDTFSFAVEARLPETILIGLQDRLTEKAKLDPRRRPASLRYEVTFEIYNEVELNVVAEHFHVVPEVSKEPETGWGIGGERPRQWRTVISRERGRPSSIKGEYKDPDTDRYKKVDFNLHINPQQLALANVPLDSNSFPETVFLRQLLEESVMRYEPDWATLRTACPPGQPKQIRADAANLPWLVLWLKEEQPERFEGWVDHIRQALPNVSDVDAVEREEDHHAYLKLSYHGGYSVTSSGLSDGTLRILAMTILPYLDYAPVVICLEEPENGIHPRAIQRVIESLSSMYDSQVWLSTHSPIVLAYTDLNQVIVMRSDEDGRVRAVPGNEHPMLEEWQVGMDLGSLYAAGVLG
jgi:predicted ATPase